MVYPPILHKRCAQYIERAVPLINDKKLQEVSELSDRFLVYMHIEMQKDVVKNQIKQNPAFKEMIKQFNLEICI